MNISSNATFSPKSGEFSKPFLTTSPSSSSLSPTSPQAEELHNLDNVFAETLKKSGQLIDRPYDKNGNFIETSKKMINELQKIHGSVIWKSSSGGYTIWEERSSSPIRLKTGDLQQQVLKYAKAKVADETQKMKQSLSKATLSPQNKSEAAIIAFLRTSSEQAKLTILMKNEIDARKYIDRISHESLYIAPKHRWAMWPRETNPNEINVVTVHDNDEPKRTFVIHNENIDRQLELIIDYLRWKMILDDEHEESDNSDSSSLSNPMSTTPEPIEEEEGSEPKLDEPQ